MDVIPTEVMDDPGWGSGAIRGVWRGLFVREPEVPLQQEQLAFRIACHPLAVAAELRIMRGQQHQAGHDPLSEAVDQARVAEVGVNLPVRRNRAEVDDTDMADGRLGG